MCGRNIGIGEVYSYESGKYDGEFFTRSLHVKCFDMLSEILKEIGENEFTWDDVYDWWEDNRCYVCKHYLVDTCDPSDCDGYGNNEYCVDRTDNGMCKGGNTCDALTHACWCEKFEAEEALLKDVL